MGTADEFTGPLNLGNRTAFAIRQLAEKVISPTGSESKTVDQPLPSDDFRQDRPRIAVSRRILDGTPATPIEEGLSKTIAYFERVLRLQSRHDANA